MNPNPGNGAPRASSPSQALRRFEFANDNRDANVYKDLFTSDFEFEFVPGDSAGIPYLVTPWNRTDELTYFDHLVHGGTARSSSRLRGRSPRTTIRGRARIRAGTKRFARASC
jgi:hypothetical protein